MWGRDRMEAAAGRRIRPGGPARGPHGRDRGEGRRQRARVDGRAPVGLRCRPRRRTQGPEEDGPVHHVRTGRRGGSLAAGRLAAGIRRGARTHGHHRRVRRRRLRRHRGSRAYDGWPRAAPPVAVHRAELPRQYGGRPRLDPPWPARPAGRARDGMRRERASHRRRRAPDPRGRSRRRRVRRRRGVHRPRQLRRIRRRPHDVDELQRPAHAGIPPVRRGPRRLRDGRRGRHPRHRRPGTRAAPRRRADRGTGGLRHERGRVPHDVPARRRRRRPARDGARDPPGRHRARTDRAPERARHVHARGRCERAGRHQDHLRQRPRSRRLGHQVRDGPPARRGRRRGSHLHGARAARPGGAAHAELRAARRGGGRRGRRRRRGARDRDGLCDLERLRLRRRQREPAVPADGRLILRGSVARVRRQHAHERLPVRGAARARAVGHGPGVRPRGRGGEDPEGGGIEVVDGQERHPALVHGFVGRRDGGRFIRRQLAPDAPREVGEVDRARVQAPVRRYEDGAAHAVTSLQARVRARSVSTSAIPPRIAATATASRAVNASSSHSVPATAAITGTDSCTLAACSADSPRSAAYQIT
ncbi:hypothetical protein Lal_00014891 [Lupinus albus]|nr:hypothetical protein Lal_00014891 [Lupinus albus]